MTPNSRRPDSRGSLCEQLAETCMLQCYLIEALDLQQCEPRLRQTPAHDLLLRTLDLLHLHTTQLALLLKPLPSGHGELAGSSARLANRFVTFIRKNRAREISAILREDYALLNLAALNYQMLLTSAAALDDSAVAGLAQRHLRDLLMIIEEMTTLMRPFRAQDLMDIIDRFDRAPERSLPRPASAIPFQFSPTAA